MVPSIAFTDRSGNTEALIGIEHESIASVLRRNRIPTASVIVFSDGRPISENTLLAQGVQYTAEQIEGFDLAAIREKYTHLEAPVEPETAYVKRRLLVSRTGEMLVETARQSVDSVVDYVEPTVYKTCERFQLLDAFQDRPSDGHRVGRCDPTANPFTYDAMRYARSKRHPGELSHEWGAGRLHLGTVSGDAHDETRPARTRRIRRTRGSSPCHP
jgi:hypothetical protein